MKDAVPRKYLAVEQVKVLKNGLKTRKNNIERLITNWYNETKPKRG